VRASAGGERANPVFIDPETGLRLLATTNLIVCLKPGVAARDYFGADWKSVRPLTGTSDQFLLSLPNAVAEEVFREVTRRSAQAQVLWIEPDFVQQALKTFTPNDPRFPDQWHLLNTSQFGATAGADVKLPGAWDITQGDSMSWSPSSMTACRSIIPTWPQNIFKNPGEIASNGTDDDGNGIIDDVHGGDFYSNDNDPARTIPMTTMERALAGSSRRRGKTTASE